MLYQRNNFSFVFVLSMLIGGCGGGTNNDSDTELPVASNQSPTAVAQFVTTDMNNTVAITLAGVDSDGTISQYQIVNSPTNGALNGAGENINYIPNANFVGTDTF